MLLSFKWNNGPRLVPALNIIAVDLCWLSTTIELVRPIQECWKSLSKLPKRGRWVCKLLVKKLQWRLDCEIIYEKVIKDIYIWERTSTTFLHAIWLNCALVDKCHCNKKFKPVTQVPTSPNDSFAKTQVRGSRVRVRGSRAGVKEVKHNSQMVGWEGQGLG